MIEETKFLVSKNIYDTAVKNIPVIPNGKLTLNEPTGRFFYDPWVIKDEFKDTVWEEVLKTLPNNIGEARLIKLNFGSCYLSHSDIDDRYHLSLIGEKSYLIDLDNDRMYFLENKELWYYMNTEFRHSAANFGSIPRTQLVVRKLLSENNNGHFKKIVITLNSQHDDSRYFFDNEISPILNRSNKIGMIRDFYVNNNVVSFEMHVNQVESILQKSCDRYTIIST